MLNERRLKLSTPLQKFANVSRNRLLTRAALIGAATVREPIMGLRPTQRDENLAPWGTLVLTEERERS